MVEHFNSRVGNEVLGITIDSHVQLVSVSCQRP